LDDDIDAAIRMAAADTLLAWPDQETANMLARSVLKAKGEIIRCVMRQLARNWRVSERARGERSTGDRA
jgi:hypothetical protein